jgi:hypothetical protein
MERWRQTLKVPRPKRDGLLSEQLDHPTRIPKMEDNGGQMFHLKSLREL